MSVGRKLTINEAELMLHVRVPDQLKDPDRREVGGVVASEALRDLIEDGPSAVAELLRDDG